MFGWPLIVLVVGCGKPVDTAPPPPDTVTDADADADADADTDADTDTDTDTDTGAVSCTRQSDNALRFDCAVRLDAAGPAELQVDGRVYRSDADATEHTVTLWGLREETAYTVTGHGASVGIETGDVPDEAAPDVAVDGTATSVEGLLLSVGCSVVPYAIILDATGAVVWYQDYSAYGQGINALHWTEDGTVLVTVESDVVVELSPSGHEVAVWSTADLGVTSVLHHDLTKRNGRWYLLYAYETAGWVVDGVHVVDPVTGTLVGDVDTLRWYALEDVVLAGGTDGDGYFNFHFPGSEDATHANSVFVTPDDTLIVSFKDRDTIVAADGDPDAPTFGDAVWILEGGTDPAFDSTLTLTDAAGSAPEFDAQHCVQVGPSGSLTVLDNKQRGTSEISRALWIDVDSGAGTAEITRAVSLDDICPEQSAIFELADGAAVTTCSATSRIKEFQPGASEENWTMQVNCGFMLSRATPVDLP